MKTMVGLPAVKPNNFERALFRIEMFKREGFDKETLRGFVAYVAKSSNLSFEDLTAKMRLDFAD